MSHARFINPAETGRLLAVPVERIGKLVRSGALPQQPTLADVQKLSCACSDELHHHAVQFFDDEDFLAGVVGAFLAEGLRSEAPLVVIARPHRQELFLKCLDDLGCRPMEAIARGQFELFDASQTLEQFMFEGMPDPALFRRAISPVIHRLRERFPNARLRAYGEMVDILWHRGRPEAAVRLEELWNELARIEPFSLLCAYSMGNFESGEQTRLFQRVCETHSAVAPAEDSVQDGANDQQLREIAHLQQRIRVLERQMQQLAEANSQLLAQRMVPAEPVMF